MHFEMKQRAAGIEPTNLLQLFVYRRLGRCRRPKDPTDTIRHIVEVMLRDVATLPAPNGRRGRTGAITVHLPAALPSRRFTLDN